MSILKIGQFDSEKMLNEIRELGIKENQFCLQGVYGISDYLYGSRRIDEMEHKESEFVCPLFDLPYTNFIIEEYNLVRTRVMNISKKTCLSYHRDPTNRVHFPLVTNDDVFFIIEDRIERMNEKNIVYELEATKKHTIVNASLKNRIHVVGVIK